jgi:hypothetical protein
MEAVVAYFKTTDIRLKRLKITARISVNRR